MQLRIASLSPRLRFTIFPQSCLIFVAFLLQPLLGLILPQFSDSAKLPAICHNSATILLQTDSRHNSATILLNRAHPFALPSEAIPLACLTLSEFAGIYRFLPSIYFQLVLLSFCEQLKRSNERNKRASIE